MKKTVSKISLILTIILIFSTFYGCASSSQGMNSAAPAAQAPAASAAPAADMAAGLVSSYRASANTSVVQEALEAEMDFAEDMEDAPDTGGVAGPAANPVIDTRKIIKNVDLRLQTLTFDSGVEAIPKIAESFGGYVQDSYAEGRDMYNERGTRYASFTVRIPAERLDSFVDSVGGEFHVISKSQNSQDITESYYDSKARLDALKIQEERLLEMLKQAAELEYLLQVEKELMNVRYEIESLASSLSRMDSYVNMSTVTIHLDEVVKYVPVEDVPVTFGERILRAFSESWKSFGEFAQNFAVWFVAAFPFLLLLAVIAFIAIAIIRVSIKRGRARKPNNYYAHQIPQMPVSPASAAPAPVEQPPTEEEKKL